jgi:lipopolysaccharide export system protein LptA
VIVVQGKNVVRGDRITIHVATRAAQMESDSHGRSAPSRVRGVFYSNQPGAPGMPAAASAPR